MKKNNAKFSICLETLGDKKFFSLPKLKELGLAPNLERLPISVRIVLESLMRNCDGKKVREQDVKNLANYDAKDPGIYEVPFSVSRIVLQDFTGVPLLVDLAAMRDAAAAAGLKPEKIEPLAPVDLVIDHSVQVDYAGSAHALQRNLAIEFIRNRERYEFLKWGQEAFSTFNVVPPGIGIVHQVNLEYLAKGVMEDAEYIFPDTLVGTDSHTTMINGLGIVGWGVGGIEAEAGMLGQPITFRVPEVVGVELVGELPLGATATDLVLLITQRLRAHGVVGKFVEFCGQGAASLSLPDRATVANMAPEYGATMGFFPIDNKSIEYYRLTGRSDSQCQKVADYFKAQELFGVPNAADIDYTSLLKISLSDVVPSASGPKRPQDRIAVTDMRTNFEKLFTTNVDEGGFGRINLDRNKKIPISLDTPVGEVDNPLLPKNLRGKAASGVLNKTELNHGDILIAAITSCTNTSNPSVMIAAGLVAKKANELGLRLPATVKASLAPGSRVVTDYLQKAGLQEELDKLGFFTVGYGCTTCIGNSGPLHPEIERAIAEGDLVCASVLSGNRNFEARVHASIRANFLMSPPLVVAFALAGNVRLNLHEDVLATSKSGEKVYLRDIWPSQTEVDEIMRASLSADSFEKLYQNIEEANPQWSEIEKKSGAQYPWDQKSTYIQNPPFFTDFSLERKTIKPLQDAKLLGFFGDSVTTDHISPAGAIKADSPAGKYLLENGVAKAEFNSFGSRRGNDRVMTRGTFGNTRIKNLMVAGSEGGVTRDSSGKTVFIYDAAMQYLQNSLDLMVIAGEDYGMGSSRDWAAKGTRLLGVRAVLAKSFERIHRSNLIGMGVLPLVFKDKSDYDRLRGDEEVLAGKVSFAFPELGDDLAPMATMTLRVEKDDGSCLEVATVARVDTPIEIDYYRAGGILPYVLADIIKNS